MRRGNTRFQQARVGEGKEKGHLGVSKGYKPLSNPVGCLSNSTPHDPRPVREEHSPDPSHSQTTRMIKKKGLEEDGEVKKGPIWMSM